MPTPTEWYTPLGNRPSINAPFDRRPAGGERGGGFGSPLESDFHKERRALQNALAKKQLEMMEEKLKKARRSVQDEAQARGDRLLEPYRQQKRSPGEILRDKIANEHLKKLKEEAANRQAVYAGVGPNALGNVGAYKAGRVAARGMFTGGPTGRASINPYGSDPGIGATPGLPGLREAQGQTAAPYALEGTPAGPAQSLPPWMRGRIRPQPDWRQALQDTRSILGGREKGGTIPKTGPYELHEGEIVVSADQVDRPLMAALKADRLSKMHSGQMDGEGTGPGFPTAKSMIKDEFRGGTLGTYLNGSLEDIMGPPPGIPRPIQMPIPEGMSPTSMSASLVADINRQLEARGEPPLPLDAPMEVIMEAGERVRRGYQTPSFDLLEPTQAPPSQSELGDVLGAEPVGESLESLAAPSAPSRFEGFGGTGEKNAPFTLPAMSDEEYARSDRKAQGVRDKMDTMRDRETAVKNNMQADRLDRYLAGNAGVMDRAQFTQMTQQSSQLRKSAETIDKRREDERIRREEAEETATGNQRVFDETIKRAEATHELRLKADEAKAVQDRLTSAQEAVTSAETPEELQRTVNVLAGLLFDMEKANGTAITWGQATAMAQGLRGMASEQFSKRINDALKKNVTTEK